MPTFKIKIKGHQRDPFCISGSSITIEEHKRRIQTMKALGNKNNLVVAFSANKVRTHWKQLDYARKVPKWEREKYKNFPLSYLQRHERVPKHWDVRVYEFPVALLAVMGKKVVQYEHHYELVDQ